MSIDCNTSYDSRDSLENIIDDVFIKDENLVNNSAMHRILAGTFDDPFQGIEEDYASVDIEMIKSFGGDVSLLDKEQDKQETKSTNESKEKSTKINSTKVQNNKKNRNCYIPGLRKLPFHLPRSSCLNQTQQAMCLRVLLRCFSNENKVLTTEEKSELETYKKLIAAEQKEFLEYVKTQWDDTAKFSIKCNKYITTKWEAKIQRLQELPRYYVQSTCVPFSSEKNVTVKFLSCLKEQGFFSKIILPKLNYPCFLRANDLSLYEKYPIISISDKEKQHFKLPVSEDIYCNNFAEENNVDLVISSSGLKCLLNNIDSYYFNSWTLPVIIKLHHGKNIAYIDKKLPPVAATVPEKNTWVYKYILRDSFIQVEDKLSETKTCTKIDTSDIENQSDNESNSSNKPLQIYDNLYISDEEDDIGTKSSLMNKENVTYNLFTIESMESQNQYGLQKNIVKEYKMLIRTKTDGIEVLPNGESRPLVLAAKIEHQIGIGAEATLLEEGLQQWVSLIFRPNASLARVRITHETSEVIQIEKHTAATLSDEMKRLHDAKVTDSLKVLHNIIDKVSSLMPGQYIIRHTVSNGPFAYIYKKAEECGKNAFDLHKAYESKVFETIPITPWPSIDLFMTTPAIKYFNRMPATFLPLKSNLSESSDVAQTCSKIKHPNNHSTNEQQKGPLRRSLRKRIPSKKLQ